MSTSQRVSRGFHRLAVLLAAIPLLAGVVTSSFFARDSANNSLRAYQNVACAQRYVRTADERLKTPDDEILNLRQIGCSDSQYDTVSVREARAIPPQFSWADTFVAKLGIGLAITLAASLAIYGLVRAIGWVIGGFAAS